MATKRKVIKDTGDDERLPSMPVLTAEQLAENDAIQQALAAKKAAIGLGLPVSGNSREYQRALAVVASLAAVDSSYLSPKAINDLTESLAVIGDFDRAYERSGNKEYKEISAAIKEYEGRPHGVVAIPGCNCPPLVGRALDNNGQPKAIEYSQRFVRREVYVRSQERWCRLLMCNACGKLTVSGE